MPCELYATTDLPPYFAVKNASRYISLSRDIYALEMARISFSSSLVGRVALLLLAVCRSSFAQQEGDWTSYSSAWDFANASSKLDAVSQAQNSALLSLFNPDMPPAVGADAQVGARDRRRFCACVSVVVPDVSRSPPWPAVA